MDGHCTESSKKSKLDNSAIVLVAPTSFFLGGGMRGTTFSGWQDPQKVIGFDHFRGARPSNKVIGSDHFVQENAHFRFVTASYFMSRLSDSVFADMPTSYSIEVVGLLLT